MAYPSTQEFADSVQEKDPKQFKTLGVILKAVVGNIESETGRNFGYTPGVDGGASTGAVTITEEEHDIDRFTGGGALVIFLSNMDVLEVTEVAIGGSVLPEGSYKIDKAIGRLILALGNRDNTPSSYSDFDRLKVSYSHGTTCPDDLTQAIFYVAQIIYTDFKRKSPTQVAALRVGDFSINYQALSGFTDKERFLMAGVIAKHQKKRL